MIDPSFCGGCLNRGQRPPDDARIRGERRSQTRPGGDRSMYIVVRGKQRRTFWTKRAGLLCSIALPSDFSKWKTKEFRCRSNPNGLQGTMVNGSRGRLTSKGPIKQGRLETKDGRRLKADTQMIRDAEFLSGIGLIPEAEKRAEGLGAGGPLCHDAVTDLSAAEHAAAWRGPTWRENAKDEASGGAHRAGSLAGLPEARRSQPSEKESGLPSE